MLSNVSRQLSRPPLFAVALFGPLVTGPVAAQETLSIDRWLLSAPLSSAELPTEDPLSEESVPALFPNRDLEVGPSYWTLERRDGAASFDLETSVEVGSGALTLAHVYLETPGDRALRLTVAPPKCGRVGGWLNGQRLPMTAANGIAETSEIRIGGGWNTLLLAIETKGCAGSFGALLLPGSGRSEDEAESHRLTGVRVQASRPPGIRRGYPVGWIEIGEIAADGEIAWIEGGDDLLGTLRYEITAWGRGEGQGIPDVTLESDRPTDPPAMDLTGRWDITMFTPQGLRELTAELEMEPDGTLDGELRGDQFGGEISDGWVSGDEFGFVVRLSSRRGTVDITYRGVLLDDLMDGTVTFGVLGEFSSGFEGRRIDGRGNDRSDDEEPKEGEDPGEQEPAEARPPDQGDRPGGRRGGRRERPGAFPGAGAGEPLSNDAQRQLIRQQLLPPPDPVVPAPRSVEVQLRAGGERVRDTVQGLRPVEPFPVTARLPFEALRETALGNDGVRFELDWQDEEAKQARLLAADGLLLALHGPIALEGWRNAVSGQSVARPSAGTRVSGNWRVPAHLAGFSLELDTEGALGEYTLDGEPLAEADGRVRLCSPCERGRRLRLEVEVTEAWSGEPRAFVTDPGFPAARERAHAPPATDWLRALGRSDNRDYLRLAEQFGTGREPR